MGKEVWGRNFPRGAQERSPGGGSWISSPTNAEAFFVNYLTAAVPVSLKAAVYKIINVWTLKLIFCYFIQTTAWRIKIAIIGYML